MFWKDTLDQTVGCFCLTGSFGLEWEKHREKNQNGQIPQGHGGGRHLRATGIKQNRGGESGQKRRQFGGKIWKEKGCIRRMARKRGN